MNIIYYIGSLIFLSSTILIAETSRQPEGVYIEQKLNQKAELNLTFLDENGKRVQLQDFFHDKPVIIAPSYFECPRLCTLVYNGLRDTIDNTKWITPGKDYRIISISFHPDDPPSLAKEKGKNYRNSLKNYQVSQKDWVFLVTAPGKDNRDNAKKLLNSLGYYYKKDGNDYSHPAGIIFLTPDGRISKYLYGIQFSTRDFRFALIDASEGKIGTPIDSVLLTCFRYDSLQGKYTPFAWGFIRLGGIFILVFVLGLVLILTFLDYRDKKKNLNLK